MAGPYCKDWSGHLAACAPGMEHDRKQTGHDHTTAISPSQTSD
jgi:hypothetical protein